jgi:hypothetical protein
VLQTPSSELSNNLREPDAEYHTPIPRQQIPQFPLTSNDNRPQTQYNSQTKGQGKGRLVSRGLDYEENPSSLFGQFRTRDLPKSDNSWSRNSHYEQTEQQKHWQDYRRERETEETTRQAEEVALREIEALTHSNTINNMGSNFGQNFGQTFYSNIETDDQNPDHVFAAATQRANSIPVIIDCGASRSMGSEEAVCALHKLVGGTYNKDTKMSFSFAGNGKESSRGSYNVNAKCFGPNAQLEVHAIRSKGTPILLSVSTLRNLNAVLYCGQNIMSVRPPSSQRTVFLQLDQQPSGHMTLDLANPNFISDAKARSLIEGSFARRR